MQEQDRGFRVFAYHEIEMGRAYAREQDKVELEHSVLEIIGNHAGAIRLEQQVPIQVAARVALTQFLDKKPWHRWTTEKYSAYVHAFAHMLSMRSVAKRQGADKVLAVKKKTSVIKSPARKRLKQVWEGRQRAWTF